VVTVEIRTASTPADLDEVRRLLHDYIAWQRARPSEIQSLVSAYFDERGFESDLERLPGEFGPPDGELLIAWDGDEAIGTVASHRFDAESSEMKRMFVAPRAQGRGVGRLLANEIVARARSAGFRRMLLDTSPGQEAAISLYRSLGFESVGPYAELEDALREGLVFFRLDLRGSPPPVK
jgi:GNAT superfamily N-acetyltransferase